jgi:hypothetical protein
VVVLVYMDEALRAGVQAAFSSPTPMHPQLQCVPFQELLAKMSNKVSGLQLPMWQ